MLDRLLGKFEAVIIITIIIAITAIITVDVFSRYVLHISMASASELARFLLVWLSMVAAASGFKYRQHSGVDLLVRILPPRLQRIVAIFNHIVIMGYFGLLAYTATSVLMIHMSQGRLSPALRLPMWIVTLGILVGAILALIRVAQCLVEDAAEHHQ